MKRSRIYRRQRTERRHMRIPHKGFRIITVVTLGRWIDPALSPLWKYSVEYVFQRRNNLSPIRSAA